MRRVIDPLRRLAPFARAIEPYRVGPDTPRLLHRAFTLDDAESYYSLNSNVDVMRFTCEPLVASMDAARDAIRNYSDFERYGFGRWACVLKHDQSVIGFCGLKYLSDLDAVDVGYRFLPHSWGMGLATEACTASLEFGFQVLGLTEIIGLVIPENHASIRVLEKSGMILDDEFEYDNMNVLRYVKRSFNATRVT